MSKAHSTLEQDQIRAAIRAHTSLELLSGMGSQGLMELQESLGFGGDHNKIIAPAEWLPPGRLRLDSLRTLSLHPLELPIAERENVVNAVRRIALMRYLVPMELGRGLRLPALTTWMRFVRTLVRLTATAASLGKLGGGKVFGGMTTLDLAVSLPKWEIRNLSAVFKLHEQGAIGDWVQASGVEVREMPIRGTPIIEASKPADPFQPFSDEFTAEGGRQALGYARVVGPIVIAALQSLRVFIEGLPQLPKRTKARRVRAFLSDMDWPDFDVGSPGFAGSPRSLRGLLSRARLLQACHLFMVLLAIGGRSSEVLGLSPGCVRGEGEDLTIDGFEHKPVFDKEGHRRQWPIAEECGRYLRQQEQLMAAVDAILGEGFVGARKAIWCSVREKRREFHDPTMLLAAFVDAFGLRKLLGDSSPSPSRFRKTFSRLIALSLVGAPKILMDMLGHKSIDVTLKYIHVDPRLRDEILEVAHAQVAFRQAEILDGRIEDSGGRAQERLLGLRARGDPFMRSVAVTTGAFQAVEPNVVCTKTIFEAGPCSQGKGYPDVSRCRPDCAFRWEDPGKRQEVDQEILRATESLERAGRLNDRYAAEMLEGQLLAHLDRFAFLREKWRDNPVVRRVLKKAGRYD